MGPLRGYSTGICDLGGVVCEMGERGKERCAEDV